jgi:hypothetical protein
MRTLSAVRSARHAQEIPRDDEALDLLGPLVQLGDLRIAHHPLDRVVRRVAVATEDLDRVSRHGHRRVAGEELRHRGPAHRVRRSGLDLGAGAIEQVARRLGSRRHVGQHRLDHLELADGLAELDARPRIVDCDVGRALREAHRLRRDARSRMLERVEREAVSLSLRADEILGGHTHIVEEQLGRR